jgi:murein DD-endopeptidase MepM/ murein hydrolase activator NlpD
VPGHHRISSGYGGRTNPISGRREVHSGIDIPAPVGTNIIAAAAGVVIMSQYNGGFGYTVVINHGGGLSTLYAHNSRLLVSAGETVAAGHVIARAGSTGFSTGSHLHFEVRLDGGHVDPIGYLTR